MDDLSLAAISAVALANGIQFLYAQAGEALTRWRARRDDPSETADDGRALDVEALERLEPEIRALRAAIGDQALGQAPVDPGNPDLLLATDALRRALEVVFREPITFDGERRDDRADVDHVIEVDVREVAGYVAGVRARVVEHGRLRVSVSADAIRPGGRVVGLDLDRLG